MELLELILQRPIETLSPWLIIAWAFLQLAKMAMNLITTAITNNAKLQTGNQQIIQQDNHHQGRLLDEMTARRISDDEHKKTLASQNQELMALIQGKATSIDEKTTRIDTTTTATHGTANEIRSELAILKQAMRAMYTQLKKEGVLQ